jgi:hypothetical protein
MCSYVNALVVLANIRLGRLEMPATDKHWQITNAHKLQQQDVLLH